MIKYFFSGFFVKTIAGFDDTLVRIPILADITRTKSGRFAFAIGTFFAIIFAVIFAMLFGSVIKSSPYHHYLSGGLILLLAFSIYFEWFKKKEKKNAEKIRKMKKPQQRTFLSLVFIGFLVSIVTVMDDTIAYSSLFLGDYATIPFVLAGLFFATFIQLGIMIYFSEKIMNLKYKKEATFFGLLVLAVLIFAEII